MRRWPPILAVLLATVPALAQEGSDLAPESAPTPPDRPEQAAPPGASAPDPDLASDQTPSDTPPEDAPGTSEPEGEAIDPADATPEELDAETLDAAPEAVPAESAAPSDDAAPADPDTPRREVLAETSEELAACLAELDALGATYELSEPITDPDQPGCGIANPVTLIEVGPGVAFDPPSPTRCAAALAAARWAATVVLPLSQRLDRGPVTAVAQGTAYVCRPRADGRVSDHSYGNALDVIGFHFAEGDPIPVEPRAGDGTIEEAFQRAVRAGACLDFTTVLGPGSDEDHADHLHLDVKERENGFRICQ